MIVNFDNLKNYRQQLLASSKKMQNSASMKRELRKETAQRTCTVITPLPKKSAIRCNVYTLFFVYFSTVRLLVYAVPKSSWPGKLLNFTEIHRKILQKLSFSIETNPFYVL